MERNDLISPLSSQMSRCLFRWALDYSVPCPESAHSAAEAILLWQVKCKNEHSHNGGGTIGGEVGNSLWGWLIIMYSLHRLRTNVFSIAGIDWSQSLHGRRDSIGRKKYCAVLAHSDDWAHWWHGTLFSLARLGQLQPYSYSALFFLLFQAVNRKG